MTRVRGQPTPPSATMVPYRDSFARFGGRVTSGRAPAAGTRGRLPGIYTKARRRGGLPRTGRMENSGGYARPFRLSPSTRRCRSTPPNRKKRPGFETCATRSAHGRYTAARVARGERRRRRVRRLRLALRGATGCEDLDTNGHADHPYRDRKIGRASASLPPPRSPTHGRLRSYGSLAPGRVRW